MNAISPEKDYFCLSKPFLDRLGAEPEVPRVSEKVDQNIKTRIKFDTKGNWKNHCDVKRCEMKSNRRFFFIIKIRFKKPFPFDI